MIVAQTTNVLKANSISFKYNTMPLISRVALGINCSRGSTPFTRARLSKRFEQLKRALRWFVSELTHIR